MPGATPAERAAQCLELIAKNGKCTNKDVATIGKVRTDAGAYTQSQKMSFTGYCLCDVVESCNTVQQSAHAALKFERWLKPGAADASKTADTRKAQVTKTTVSSPNKLTDAQLAAYSATQKKAIESWVANGISVKSALQLAATVYGRRRTESEGFEYVNTVTLVSEDPEATMPETSEIASSATEAATKTPGLPALAVDESSAASEEATVIVTADENGKPVIGDVLEPPATPKEGVCKGEIGSMDARCGVHKLQGPCEGEGKSALSDGVCDWEVSPCDETDNFQVPGSSECCPAARTRWNAAYTVAQECCATDITNADGSCTVEESSDSADDSGAADCSTKAFYKELCKNAFTRKDCSSRGCGWNKKKDACFMRKSMKCRKITHKIKGDLYCKCLKFCKKPKGKKGKKCSGKGKLK